MNESVHATVLLAAILWVLCWLFLLSGVSCVGPRLCRSPVVLAVGCVPSWLCTEVVVLGARCVPVCDVQAARLRASVGEGGAVCLAPTTVEGHEVDFCTDIATVDFLAPVWRETLGEVCG